MFSTMDSDRIALPVGLQEPNQSVWSHVELLLSVPWLLLFARLWRRRRAGGR